MRHLSSDREHSFAERSLTRERERVRAMEQVDPSSSFPLARGTQRVHVEHGAGRAYLHGVAARLMFEQTFRDPTGGSLPRQ
jgi:hypothetical protein